MKLNNDNKNTNNSSSNSNNGKVHRKNKRLS